jgi:GcrA cell cycle regulator
MSMSAAINPWSQERVDLLKAMCEASESYGEIAKRINAETGARFTRNACLGKAARLGLVKERATVVRPTEPTVTVQRKRKLRAKPRQAPTFEDEESLVREEGAAPRHFLGVKFEDNDGCWFVHGGEKPGEPMFFCGQPRIPTKRWCRDCCNIVYDRASRRPSTEQRQDQMRAFA